MKLECKLCSYTSVVRDRCLIPAILNPCSSLLRYFLQPRENGNKSVKADELGSLRLNIVYTEDHVFPSERYSPLTDLLLQSAQVEVSLYI